MGQRNDGLLRGSRDDRIDEMSRLSDDPWSLDTLLNAHMGLLDHAEDVRATSLVSLMEIARRSNEPLSVSPLDLILRFGNCWTVASAMVPTVLAFLLDLGSADADEIALRLATRGRNEDFELFVKNAIAKKRESLLSRLQEQELSKTKSGILRRCRAEG